MLGPFHFNFLKLRSLKLKFALTCALVFLAIFIAASFVLIRQSSDFQRESLFARAKTFAKLATSPIGNDYNLYFNSGRIRFRENLKTNLNLNDTISELQIISVEGTILFDSKYVDDLTVPTGVDKIKDATILKAVTSPNDTEIKNTNGEISELIVPYFDSFGGRPFSVRYFISYETIYANINQAILTTVALVVGIFLATLITVTLLVNRSILSPLGKIINIAREIREGNLQKKIEVNTRDELDDLALSLNQMTDTLRKDIEGLKQVDKLKDEFILIASHNLRTPLTVIKGYIAILKEKKWDDETNKGLNVLETNTQKLETITESLLNIVSLEGEKEPLAKTKEDLVEVIKGVVTQVQEQATKKKIKVTLNVPEIKVEANIDKKRFSQALLSVVDNAVKFNKESGVVVVKLEVKNKEALFTVTDNGVGISPEEQTKMFQKFHRGTDVLTYNYEGIGLGLYLAKVVVESHQGNIGVQSEVGKGTSVTISLPIE